MELAVEYLGLRLNSPFVVGSGPGADDVPLARGLHDAGAGAIVMLTNYVRTVRGWRE